MTYHLIFSALALLMAASAMTTWVQTRPIARPAYAAIHATSRAPTPGRGFAGAFGNGVALRNLLYVN